MSTAPPSLRARLRLAAIRVLLALLAIELPSFLAGKVLEQRGYLYAPPRTNRIAAYLAGGRERNIGWLPTPELDASGARPLPAFPDPVLPVCITLYGDSFAWSAEVDDEHAWANVLARKVGCRVTSFGVPGYGTDQAYLRYLHQGFDRTRVAILGILSENLIRNVNQYRRLLSRRSELTLKPRFILDPGGALRLIPIPGEDAAEVEAIVLRPEDRLPHDYFVPGGPSGIARLRFPYVGSLLGVFGDYRIRAHLGRRSYYQDFFAPDHPSGALPLTVAIGKAFQDEAVRRGATPLVVVIPLVEDLVELRKSGVLPYHALVEGLERAGVTVLDAGPTIAEALGGRSPCALYTQCTLGHFNEEGYRVMGEMTARWVEERGGVKTDREGGKEVR